MANELDPTLVDRFRADFEGLIGRPLGANERVGIAVSGGPDSMALLLLAHAAYDAQVMAATVDHGLRPESAEEAHWVADQCEARAIEHTTLSGEMPRTKLGLQADARDHRYRLLGRWAKAHMLAFLATAHHADDQAETLLMRIARGSGLKGLAAIRSNWILTFPIFTRNMPYHEALNAGPISIRVLRPLIHFTKAELVRVVDGAGLEARDDPSNRDERFDRTKARRLLVEHGWLSAKRLSVVVDNLAEAERAMEWATQREWRKRAHVEVEDDLIVTLDPSDLPSEIGRRLVEIAISTILIENDPLARMPELRGSDLKRLAEKLHAGRTATLAGVKCVARGDVWTFTPAPPRRTG